MRLHKRSRKILGESTVYEEINYNKKILSQLVDTNIKYFKKLKSSGYVSYKENEVLHVCVQESMQFRQIVSVTKDT